MKNLIYLDNNSTTQIDQRVLEVMLPYFSDIYANAGSNHKFGVEAKNAVDNARKKIADFISCNPNEVIFTSGATESINLAFKGLVTNTKYDRKNIVTVQTEHKAVLDTCFNLEKSGYKVTYLPVEKDGLLNLNTLNDAITEDTLMVSVMMVNNETGVIQPINEIAKIAHSKGSFFMTDATQAFAKIPIDVNSLGIDLMSFSAHKAHGPKGIGGLYVRQTGKFKPKIHSQIDGGGHEKGLRSGTLNVPGIVALGKISELAINEMNKDKVYIKSLRDLLENELLKLEKSFINGNKEQRLHNVINICFEGVDSEALIIGLSNPESDNPAIIISNGSACSSYSIEPSHVLTAMGRSQAETFSSVRLSLCKLNTPEETQKVVEAFHNQVLKLRAMAS